ncbi:MAG TPA: fatty acid--CoA ligase family protein [Longimicrobium sp.]
MNPETLAGALHGAWIRWPQRTALVHGGRRTTYAQLGDAITAVAALYRDLGIGAGDRVLCPLSNRPELLVAAGAAWTAGAVHVGADHGLTAAELSALVELTGASALVFEPAAGAGDPFAALDELRAARPGLRVLVVGGLAPPEGCVRLSAVIAACEAGGERGIEVPDGPDPADPAAIFVTSGTTGRPKAPVSTHGNLRMRWRRLADRLGFGPGDVHLAYLPLSHGFGMMMAMSALSTGGRLVLLERFDAAEALRRITEEGVTVVSGSAAHFRLLLDRRDPARHDLRTLRMGIGSAASFPPALLRAVYDELGMEFMLMYGSSEGVGVVTTDRDDVLRGSVGRPSPGSVAVLGPGREPLPPGEVGEIAFSRAFFPVRYWGDPAPVADGWYHSGDLGRLDDEGRLYVLGRIKHQINSGGLKVDPVEVEGALLRCPGVRDAAVLGLPHAVYGETVCACVVPEPGAEPSLEALRAELGGALAPHKLPRELCLLDQIPRTPLGKVDLPALRGQVEARGRPVPA